MVRRGPSMKALLAEGAVVTLLLALAGFFYLLPASTELLRGNAQVMVGDGGDSLTDPWQYRLVLDVFRAHPQDLLFGAGMYSDQMNAPEGAVHFMPWIQRILVLLYAPIMQPDLMPTAMAWGLMVLSGLCFHVYGRVVGWPRAVAFALALAWAFCPFTRSRATVHLGFVGTYWVPALFTALHVLARPPGTLSLRRATVLAAGLMVFALFAAHYFVVIAVVMTPLFLLYYFLVLPSGASRASAAARIAVAAAPAAAFLLFSLSFPAPSYATRALKDVTTTRSDNDYMLKVGGAHPTDYLTGDVKLGDRDLIPLRQRMMQRTREEVIDNRHERANGIRWTVLACSVLLAVGLVSPRLRRRFSREQRILGGFAFVLGVTAFLLALSPQGLRVYDQDLGPVQLVTRIMPRFRVPNRSAILVHFAALLAAGVLLSRVMRRRLAAPGPVAALLGAALSAVVLLDYPPRFGVFVAAVVPQRADLEAAAHGAPCGAGITVPYVTWGFHDEDYYAVYASLRGTSCQILHAAYNTAEDLTLRTALGKPSYSEADRLHAERLARCGGASWVMFRKEAPPDLRRAFCAEMGWSFVADDVCRAPASTPPPRLRSLRECSVLP